MFAVKGQRSSVRTFDWGALEMVTVQHRDGRGQIMKWESSHASHRNDSLKFAFIKNEYETKFVRNVHFTDILEIVLLCNQ